LLKGRDKPNSLIKVGVSKKLSIIVIGTIIILHMPNMYLRRQLVHEDRFL
jgi:hypothetical protein